ncbi:ATP-binding domain-containing protein [Pseudomonas sp. CFBP 8771]|uniref:DEAD/DEAH box helicase n=1 Tax=Pseudomonas sp. CFBP 8771 TaxID=2775285 RepID=UPI001783383B|nr:ATP-binding domain-containing protein [Pseudomonas sp. CFBP 8771]MBD8602434.1 ATP-binding domain-containing protein [Pseudomonas sp. CFBP 8771]
MTDIIWGSTKKPVSSNQLAEFFKSNPQYGGHLFIGYPIIGTPNGPHPIDAIWLSREHGLLLFNLIEGRSTLGYEEAQDDSFNTLEAKLRNHKSLMKGRKLQIPPNVVTFAPATTMKVDTLEQEHPICNSVNLHAFIDELPIFDNAAIFESVLAVIQSISTIRKGKRKRETTKPTSRGAILKTLEDSIANLDNLQGSAVIETVQGVQRIRGLAGSGKTIVLALKAAYLHAQHPEWKIAVTFNTRSLKAQFKRLINTFVIEHTNEEPDWDNLQIINAWGGPGGAQRTGMYYTFCQTHGVEFLDYQTAKARYGRNKDFEGACDKALKDALQVKPLYDVILIDEAQDFSPSFLRLCYEFLTKDKRLVYAYDELQSLSEKSLPSPEEIFGTTPGGQPRVKFDEPSPGKPKQDIILEKCYRNSRPILTTAHALGFGIYRKADPKTGTGLIQMFDQSHLWSDVGYEVKAGHLEDGHDVSLARTEFSSPAFLEDHSDVSDLVQFKAFNSEHDQAAWLAAEIESNIKNDELNHDDIIVINPDPLTTRNAVGPARKILFEKGINSHLAGVDTSQDVFFESEDDSVVFTGIYRAKGNEAGMVYIINAHDCYYSFGSLARMRNMLFTAITRSKAWVRVLGVGPQMVELMEEFEAVKQHNFELSFRYPTDEERKNLNIVNRDMSSEEKGKIIKTQESVAILLKEIEQGKVFLDDLPKEQLDRLRTLLNKEGRQ